jgi:DNA-binding transcriptional regulator GbsR (MarR family)
MARTAPSGSEIDDFVERIARDTAMEGFPRIGGRIFGLLLASEGDLCLDEIASRLKVSKGSISSDARRLEQRGILERASRPGDRRDYYRVPDDLFERTMALRLGRWRAFQDAIRSGRRALPARSPATRRLDGLGAAFTFMSEEVERALARWGRRRRPRAGRRA